MRFISQSRRISIYEGFCIEDLFLLHYSAVATAALGSRGRVDRKYGTLLLLVYAAAYPILIAT
ncbi:MAG: hypothetical protein ACR2RB_14070 [Gammaproteobacteria bacterium]